MVEKIESKYGNIIHNPNDEICFGTWIPSNSLNLLRSDDVTKDVKDNILELFKENNYRFLLQNIVSLHYDINSLKLFYRWRRKKKDCFMPNSSYFINILPYLFVSSKEASLWKRKSTRSLNNQDLDELDMSFIKIIEWPDNFKNIDIFHEIRDAIEHSKCVYTSRGELIIDNPINLPKHAYNFKAVVDCHLLVDFMLIQSKIDRRGSDYFWGFKEWYENIKDLKNYDVRDVLEFTHVMNKESERNPIITMWKTPSEIKNQIDDSTFDPDKYDYRSVVLTDGQCQMIYDFFSTHWLAYWNLDYLAKNLVDHNMSEYYILYLLLFFWDDSKRDYRYQDFINEFYENSKFDFAMWLVQSFCSNSPEILDVLESITHEIWKLKQKNGQPLLWHTQWILDFISKKFQNAWFTYDYFNGAFKKWDIEFWGKMLDYFYSYLLDSWKITRYNIEEFPNFLKIQLMRMIYASVPLEVILEIEKNNVGPNWTIELSENSNWKAFSEEERIRNAFAHNTYSFLHGVDYILLRDWFNKKDNTWSWEKKYNLEELYNKTYSIFNEAFKNNLSDD